MNLRQMGRYLETWHCVKLVGCFRVANVLIGAPELSGAYWNRYEERGEEMITYCCHLKGTHGECCKAAFNHSSDAYCRSPE